MKSSITRRQPSYQKQPINEQHYFDHGDSMTKAMTALPMIGNAVIVDLTWCSCHTCYGVRFVVVGLDTGVRM